MIDIILGLVILSCLFLYLWLECLCRRKYRFYHLKGEELTNYLAHVFGIYRTRNESDIRLKERAIITLMREEENLSGEDMRDDK
jgi:hypothetical protein